MFTRGSRGEWRGGESILLDERRGMTMKEDRVGRETDGKSSFSRLERKE